MVKKFGCWNLVIGICLVFGIWNLVIPPPAAWAAISQYVTVQGRLTDNPAPPAVPTTITGNRDFTFQLYNAAAAGNPVGAPIKVLNVPVSDGIFTAEIPIPAGFYFGGEYWVGVKVGDDPEMTTRQHLTSVPYAFRAGVADLATDYVRKDGGGMTGSLDIRLGRAIDEQFGLLGLLNHDAVRSGVGVEGGAGTGSLSMLAAIARNNRVGIAGATSFADGYAGYFAGGRGVKVEGDVDITGDYKKNGVVIGAGGGGVPDPLTLGKLTVSRLETGFLDNRNGYSYIRLLSPQFGRSGVDDDTAFGGIMYAKAGVGGGYKEGLNIYTYGSQNISLVAPKTNITGNSSVGGHLEVSANAAVGGAALDDNTAFKAQYYPDVYGVMGRKIQLNNVDYYYGVGGVASREGSVINVGILGKGKTYGVAGESDLIGVFGSGFASGVGVFGSGGAVGGSFGSATGHGVYGESRGLDKAAVVGEYKGARGRGVIGIGVSDAGVKGTGLPGVLGLGLATNDTGVKGQSTSGTGVFGQSASGFGIYGKSTSNAGGSFESVSGIGIFGQSRDSAGIFGKSTNSTAGSFESALGSGITAKGRDGGVFDGTPWGYGVIATGANGGVKGLISSNWYGQLGGFEYIGSTLLPETWYNYGVYGRSTGTITGRKYAGIVGDGKDYGVVAYGLNGPGLIAASGGGVYQYAARFYAYHEYQHDGRTDPGYGIGVAGAVRATQPYQVVGSGILDVAEWIKTSDNSLLAGDVVVIDKTSEEKVAKNSEPYSTLVAGIVSTSPGMILGYHDKGGKLDPMGGATDEEMEAKGFRKLALAGRVPCNVSTENGSIEIGDLLTTSSTPGYAMKVTDKIKAIGAVIGKALEPLKEGKGKIMVLVTLQ